MKSTFVFLASFLACGLAHAAPDEAVVRQLLRDSHGISAEEIRNDYDACDDGTTFAMRICNAYRLAAQDIRLNRAYSQALAQAGDPALEASLRKAERAWIAYRESQCAFEGENGAGGGTAQPLFVLGCKLELTKLQADRLEAGLIRR